MVLKHKFHKKKFCRRSQKLNINLFNNSNSQQEKHDSNKGQITVPVSRPYHSLECLMLLFFNLGIGQTNCPARSEKVKTTHVVTACINTSFEPMSTRF